MNVAGMLGLIFICALMVEGLVEYVFGEIANHVKTLEPYKWLTMYIALAVGVGGALVYQFDMLVVFAQWANVPIEHNVYGVVLTGLAIGRGSNYIHDLIKNAFIQVFNG
jgi:hypothetical protein